MKKSQRNRLIVALGILGFSIVTQGNITAFALLFAVPFLPIQKKYRIYTLLCIGLLEAIYTTIFVYLLV